MKYLNPKDKLR